MSTCRSSSGCGRPAGHGRFGTFCAEHAAALAELRGAHFTTEGTARAHAAAPAERGPSAEDDARQIALEVLRLGDVARNVLQHELGFTYTRFRRAVELAGRWEWIVAGRALAPGRVVPPDRPASPWESARRTGEVAASPPCRPM